MIDGAMAQVKGGAIEQLVAQRDAMPMGLLAVRVSRDGAD